MLVLGLESSCDDTGVAIYHSQKGLLAHRLHSQLALHQPFGGVVPELASRDHIRHITPLIRQVLKDANTNVSDIEGVAYTAGPGLKGGLLVGATVARSLAWALGVSCLGVNHLEGHVMACLLEKNKPHFPFVCLLVSGGHTELLHVKSLGEYALLGQTLDDAAGEAFDKVAKLLGLGYPGGPQLAKSAVAGHASRFYLPRPMLNRPGLDFSFSGLKTAVRQLMEESSMTETNMSDKDTADVAKAFELAVVETLVKKCDRALNQTGCEQLVLVGGVAANLSLRESMKKMTEKKRVQVFYPRQEYCTDNGAMIAQVGAMRMALGQQDSGLASEVQARWPLSDLSPPQEI